MKTPQTQVAVITGIGGGGHFIISQQGYLQRGERYGFN